MKKPTYFSWRGYTLGADDLIPGNRPIEIQGSGGSTLDGGWIANFDGFLSDPVVEFTEEEVRALGAAHGPAIYSRLFPDPPLTWEALTREVERALEAYRSGKTSTDSWKNG